jgi:polyhydroxyalkanoate synthesis repressor PhaR
MLRGNSNDNSAQPAKVVLKKYGKNRRLYDTSSSRYVNLDEVATLVRNGTEVQIVDAKTGEDLTRGCLMQIVMEDAKEKPTGLPLELLRQLVVASDHVGREFIMWYLNSAFDAYRKVQNTVENGLSEVKSAATSPLQLVKTFIQSTVSEKQPERQAEETELQQLRKRIAELEKRAGGPARKRRRSKATTSPTR